MVRLITNIQPYFGTWGNQSVPIKKPDAFRSYFTSPSYPFLRLTSKIDKLVNEPFPPTSDPEAWEQLWERGCLFLSLSTISLWSKTSSGVSPRLSTVLSKTDHARKDCMYDHNISVNGKTDMLFTSNWHFLMQLIISASTEKLKRTCSFGICFIH